MTWKESQNNSDNEHDGRNDEWPMQMHRGGCRSGRLEMPAAHGDKLDAGASKGNENQWCEDCETDSNLFSSEHGHGV